MQSSRSEEAHWSSFRGEVLQLQQALVQSLLENNDNGSSPTIKTSRDKINSKRDNASLYCSQTDSKGAISGKQKIESGLSTDENDTAPNNYHDDMPQSQPPLSPLKEVGDDFESINNNEHNIKNYNTTQAHHQYLELIGMEEVDRSICSVNNKTNLSSHDNTTNYNNATNANAMSHVSQNTNALSIATQELAEMKLKLALTESERDELEFELMQKQV